MSAHAVPYARLSGFYFFYFAALGAFLPYWGLYLQSRGHGAAQIGIVLAILLGTRIVGPFVWAWIADHRGSRLPVVQLSAWLALLFFIPIALTDNWYWLCGLMFLHGFFLTASLPQFEAVTLNHLQRTGQDYGRVRLWGSVGFILAVVLLGAWLEQASLDWVPVAVGAMLLGLALVSLVVPETAAETPAPDATGFWTVLRQPVVLALLAACFLSQFSFAPYYGFLSIYLEQHGYGRGAIGALWALGVVAEIGVFIYMGPLLRRFGARQLMLAALALTALRWVMLVLFVEHLPLLLVAQILHLASFGIYHAVSVHLIHGLFRGRLQGRGQALYSSLSFGAGGAVGSLVSGFLWEVGPDWVAYAVAATSAALAWLVCWRWLVTK